MDKKEKKHKDELRIFNSIYANRKDLSIDLKDKPDVWVTNNIGKKFGVEITQIYTNESSARLENLPNYLSDLIGGGKFKHKDDKDHIIVDEITIIDKENNLKLNDTAVITQGINEEKYYSLIEERIKEKDKKSIYYDKELNYYNLIIEDNTSGLNFKLDTVINHFSKRSISRTILESCFKEIYLIVFIGNEKYYLALRNGIYVYNLFLFDTIINKLYNLDSITEELYYSFLIEFLNFRNFKNLHIIKNEDNWEIIFSNIGFNLGENSINMKLYEIYLPKEAFIAKITSNFITNEVEELIMEIEKKFELHSPLAFSINEDGKEQETNI